MRSMLLAAALAATAAIAVPTIAPVAQETPTQQAQAAPSDEHWGEERGDGPARWMHGPGMEGGWRGMMMQHMMMHRNPQEWCEERLARRAARLAYLEVRLNLTPEQRPLWDKVQSAAQAEEQKEHQLCSALKPGGDATMLDRLDRLQQFLSARLEGLQAAKPAVQALYQALTPEQRAIFDHPFRR